MITAHALAHTDPIERFLNRVGSLPNSQVHAYAIVALSLELLVYLLGHLV